MALDDYFSGYNLSYSYNYEGNENNEAITLKRGYVQENSIDIDCDISTTEI